MVVSAVVVTAPSAAEQAAEQAATAEQRTAVVVGLPRLQRGRVTGEVATVTSLHRVVRLLGAEDGVTRFAHHRAARPIVNRQSRGPAHDGRAGRVDDVVVSAQMQSGRQSQFQNHCHPCGRTFRSIRK